jgi:hypothetical protein
MLCLLTLPILDGLVPPGFTRVFLDGPRPGLREGEKLAFLVENWWLASGMAAFSPEDIIWEWQ